MRVKAGPNVAAKARAKRASRKRHVNEREKLWTAQDPPPAKGRHARLIQNPGERSDGAHRATPQGENERRGGRERAERKGGSPVAHVHGAARHSRARPHGSVGRRAQRTGTSA